MELWIRSQDKKNLVKIRQISINYQNNKQIIANYMPELYENSGGYYELLGTYKTKERAIEILDEIQKTIETHILGQVTTEWDVWYKSTVYEMPKE